MEISSGHHQVMSSYSLNEVVLPVLGYPKPPPPFSSPQMNHLPPPPPAAHPQEPLSCPRCDSGNTKFCYYNNYSLSQPRYFCKSCRRYWTKGGTLRNVPVGGGCRKNKRSSFSSPSSVVVSASSKKLMPPHDNFVSHDPSVLGFLDILRSGNPAAGGLRGLHCFGGDDGVMLPFVSDNIMVEMRTNACDNSSYHGGYWNGFFNGFTHEIHDGV